MGDWESYRDDLKDKGLISKEAQKALDLAESLTAPVKIVPKRTTNVGDRRRAAHGSWNRDPLDGYSLDHSEIARRVIGLKYAGYALKEAFEDAAERFGIKPHSVENLYYKKRPLFELAEIEHVGNAVKEYDFNRAVCRTLLSEAGPRAVETLLDVMDNPKSSPNVKSKTAIAVLKMLDVDGSASGAKASEMAASESLKVIAEIQKNMRKEQESHVVDAEDAEFLEKEDECEDRIDCTM